MRLLLKGYQIFRQEGPISFAVKSLEFVIRKMRDQTYRIGSERVCNICGFSGRKFKSFGNPARSDAMCPKCGSLERHRLLYYYIKNENDLMRGGKNILYFAPTGLLVEKMRKRGNRVITTDLRKEDIDIHADITRLPFSDGVFDIIICLHVLEHIPDDYAAMSELYRILRCEGEALIMIPKDKGRKQTYEDESITEPEARREAFGKEDHVRWYGDDFMQRLSSVGFDVSVNTYSNNLDNDLIEKIGVGVCPPAHRSETYSDRIKYEDIHIAKVPSSAR